MENLMTKNIGEIVAENYRTAQIFKNHKIDFCCKGNRSIQEVAESNKLDANILLQEIGRVTQKSTDDSIDFKEWPLDLLADYIEKKHHRYVEAQIPVLKQYLSKLCRVHGERHPELLKITEHFNKCAGELTMHMKKEELIIFPAISNLLKAQKARTKLTPDKFGTIDTPIQIMMEEHENEGGRFRLIDSLSNHYTPPADSCNTYRVVFSLLQEFEEDLHRHIHLENNILFPKALALEKLINA
ncbi:regulator of cell morphogenesis and NO signaling [Arenibacter nanhaiticus]|uniref:Regulator of cell morphogenesis and NO signaling n=1 Tax=Arenibacter nanhaiticus TaxID=558155 RepID=A0A1M6GY03_9FLAO|nr:iron-sulfur cluster repair di-iron protein [Arenibacter nanhaiticus]SHJ14839.1 regulator of cell morphogenesis and NO signaling [Arenibacter nanhaiticus]